MAAETRVAPKFRGAPASDQAPGKQNIQDGKGVLVKTARQAPMPHMPSVLVRQGCFTSVTQKTEDPEGAENFASSLRVC